MSIRKLPSRVLNTTIDIYSRSLTKSDVGDFQSNKDTLVYQSVPATIQQDTSDLEYLSSGASHYQTHVAYLNIQHESVDVVIDVDNLVVNNLDDLVYLVVSVEKHTASNKNTAPFHHYRLILESMEGFRDGIIKGTDITSKVRIS